MVVGIQRVTMADQAAELLLGRITSGEWNLGEKLPGETTLAPQLGVGRSTVREAIRQLAGRGVLTTRQGAGVFVAALDVRDDWDTVLQRADIIAVIEARNAIETAAAGLAAQRRSATDLKRIKRALAERQIRRSAIEEHVDADIAFHRYVVAAAQNPILDELFDSFTPRVRQSMIEMLRIHQEFGSDSDHDAHVQLADAIANHDESRAEELSRSHLLSLKNRLK
ncbi:FCD domain-containing protein [Rhodococcus sovatensis]|uniref:FCD domain-containing protein n=2 Tax=Rhodococcus sovatensis TaxID=1805840 RepID=A0ABZ2PRJ9_9NOCA